MKVYDKESARKSNSSQTNIFDSIEKEGLPYNWLIANYFSLNKYIESKNLTSDQRWSKKVVCKPVIIEAIHTVLCSEDGYSKKNAAKIMIGKDNSILEFNFVDKQLCSVPLELLRLCGFSIHRELILETRIHDEGGEDKSSYSIKRSMEVKNSTMTLIDGDIESQIYSNLSCKAPVFFIPEINEDGTDVEWYIPLSPKSEININNALNGYKSANKIIAKAVKSDFDAASLEKLLAKRKGKK